MKKDGFLLLPFKRVAAIHDLSGVGKCSLTVALPVLSAAGVECAALPTAVLSTHTGGFTDIVCRDLTADMLPIARHWRREGVRFDALYSGYLASYEQIEIVRKIFELFRSGGEDEPERPLVMVDPVMGDFGRLYSLYTPAMAKGMTKLCSQADILVPNRTEAAILLGREYSGDPLTPAAAEEIARALSEQGPRQVVLTGVNFDLRETGVACFDRETGRIDFVMRERIPGTYHGTGDIFASALLAGLMRGRTLRDAARIAVDFVCGAIRRTAEAGTDTRFGVRFEEGLADFAAQFR